MPVFEELAAMGDLGGGRRCMVVTPTVIMVIVATTEPAINVSTMSRYMDKYLFLLL
jgi:hypothetical protein